MIVRVERGGAFLIDKPAGISSFGAVNRLKGALRANLGIKRSRDLPKIGHGGTLDPFATGLLVVLVGQAVKLSRYHLESRKSYDFKIRFGESNAAGDPTEVVTERSERLPSSLDEVRAAAATMLGPYLQVPPMHSAKKIDGKRLYELARKGIEVERKAVACTLYSLEMRSYESPHALASVTCSSGTYVRTLAQDLARKLDTVSLLDELRRTGSGMFRLEGAQPLDDVARALGEGRAAWELPCWMPISSLLSGMPRAEATEAEAAALINGVQSTLPAIAARTVFPAEGIMNPQFDSLLAIYRQGEELVAVAARGAGGWGLERVFQG
jgi:tRNA pseudouridine55 synthase